MSAPNTYGQDGQPLAARAGSATRWAARGDWVETTLSGGTVYRVKIATDESCAWANQLIAHGRWKVSPNSVMTDPESHDPNMKRPI